MNVSAVRAIVQGACVAALVVFPATTRTALLAQQARPSIRQHVRDAGGFERIVVTTYDSLQLSDLVGRSDLIVEASTPGGVSYLNTAETDIFTDYTFTVHAVIKNKRRPDFRAGHSVTIRRDSGVIVIDGRTAVTHENGFPPFNANEHYILFLTERPHEQTYSVFGGPQGAFTSGEQITTLALPLSDGADPPSSMSRAAFLGEVRALLHYSEN